MNDCCTFILCYDKLDTRPIFHAILIDVYWTIMQFKFNFIARSWKIGFVLLASIFHWTCQLLLVVEVYFIRSFYVLAMLPSMFICKELFGSTHKIYTLLYFLCMPQNMSFGHTQLDHLKVMLDALPRKDIYKIS